MIAKKLRVLTGTTLLLSLSLACANAVRANPTTEDSQSQVSGLETNGAILLSQLRGHDVYDKNPQMQWSDYKIGTVKGQAGNVISVLLDDGTKFTTRIPSFYSVGNSIKVVQPGDQVLVVEENGIYRVAGPVHPSWLLILEEKYKVRRL